MRKSRAALASAAFFVVAPGTVVGLIPWLITHWQMPGPWPYWIAAHVVGAVLIFAGLVAAVLVILGQALLFASLGLLIYAAIAFLASDVAAADPRPSATSRPPENALSYPVEPNTGSTASNHVTAIRLHRPPPCAEDGIRGDGES